jgi:hypothetical protein
VRPSQEYLCLFDELIECRDDVSLNLVQHKLQEALQRDSDRISPEIQFVENYWNSKAAIHLHWTIRLSSLVCVKLCAVVESINTAGDRTAAISNRLRALDERGNNVQISVFVDVGQLGKKTERIIDHAATVVRLQTLDECKRRNGNPRKILGEYGIRERRIVRNGRITTGLIGNLRKKRKLTTPIPVAWEQDPASIMLDETERQVIEGRAHLIKHLSGQDGNFYRRRQNSDLFGLFSLRLAGDDFIRALGGILGNATLNSFQVFRSPGELLFRGLNATNSSRHTLS